MTRLLRSLPVRSTRLDAVDPDSLAAVQPERKRRYDQIGPGRFRGDIREESLGRAALLHERWGCGVRVRCDRPRGYAVFAVPAVAEAPVVWCGTRLAPGMLLRIDDAWELATPAPFPRRSCRWSCHRCGSR